MLRTIITPTETNISLSIPQEYVGKTIEVTLLSIEDKPTEPGERKMGDFWGVLSDETADTLQQQVDQSRNGW